MLELWRIWPRQAQLLKERGPRSNYSNWAPPTESAAVSSTLMVTGSIERECVKMLVDTGSAVTILRESTWKRAWESRQLQLHPPVRSVIDANGEDLDLLGQSEVTLGIGGLMEKHMIIVANGLTQKCLLGANIFYATQLCGRFTEDESACWRRNCGLNFTMTDPRPLSCHVAYLDTVVVPEYCQMQLLVSVKGCHQDFGQESDVILEPEANIYGMPWFTGYTLSFSC